MEDGGTKSVEPVIIHDTETGGGSGRAGGGAQSGTGTDNRKTVDRSWIWAAVLSVWETIKNLGQWWWDLAKARPVAGAAMLLIIIIVMFVLMSFLSILVVIAMLAAGVVLVAAGVTACNNYFKR